MKLLFYFILRKLFVKLEITETEIRLVKGLVVKRAVVLPRASIVRVSMRRTLVMRLLGAREVTVFTLGGKISFFLSKNEPLPLIPQDRGEVLKPRFLETAFGAFVDTRALGGLFVFSAALRRVSAVFGGEYFDRVINALTKTANDLERALKFFQITIPKIAITIGVFAIGAWIFAYIKKLLRLARFRVFTGEIEIWGRVLIITSGVFTLYEHALVPNSAAVSAETLTSLITRRAPLYLRGVMICPCVKRELLPKTLERLCGFKLPKNRVKSPKRAFFGHIASPLSWLGALSAGLFAAYRLEYSELLKIALYCGILVNLYTVVLYLLFMSRSGVALDDGFAAVISRRGLRLYTAVFPRSACVRSTITQSIFQKRSGLCNRKIAVVGDRRYTARLLPKRERPRRIPF